MKNSLRISGGNLKGKKYHLNLKILLGPLQASLKKSYLIGFSSKFMSVFA